MANHINIYKIEKSNVGSYQPGTPARGISVIWMKGAGTRGASSNADDVGKQGGSDITTG